MSKELYEDVLGEEPQDAKDYKGKKYRKWEKRAISVSKWIRNVMKDQLDKWEVNINIKS